VTNATRPSSFPSPMAPSYHSRGGAPKRGPGVAFGGELD
jgi:hypothetical protein